MPDDTTKDKTPSHGESQTPAIRTMRSDAQMIREKKTSLAQQILARAPLQSYQDSNKPPRMRFFSIIIGVVVLVAIGAGAFFFFFPSFSPFSFSSQNNINNAARPSFTPPAPLFRPDTTTTTIGAAASKRSLFFQKMTAIASAPAVEGKIIQVMLAIEGEPQQRFATVDDFFSLLRIQAPLEFLSRLETAPMFFFGGAGNSARFGFAVKTRDPDRTLADMIKWEPSLPGDFSPLFFGEAPPLVFPPFEDHTTQNVDWRSRTLSPERRIGIHYALFPAGNILIVTTDKALMENVIARMLHNK